MRDANTPAGSAIIEVSGLTKTYAGGFQALKGIGYQTRFSLALTNLH